jgi:hypothetical protein
MFSALLVYALAAQPKEDTATFNANQIKRAGLTMQAAIFERKAATATVMVEKYKKQGDIKQARKEFSLEKISWLKSQQLVTKAARVHPIPNAYVARAAVQLKVATEATRVMKQKMDTEKDSAKKRINEMVYKIESANVVAMTKALKFADAERKREEEDEKELAPIKARIAAEEAEHKKDLAIEETLKNKLGKSSDKKLADKEMVAAHKLEGAERALEKLVQKEEVIDNDLEKEADSLETFSVGKDVAKDHHVAQIAKDNLKTEKAEISSLKKEEHTTDRNYENALKREMGAHHHYVQKDAQINIEDLLRAKGNVRDATGWHHHAQPGNKRKQLRVTSHAQKIGD